MRLIMKILKLIFVIVFMIFFFTHRLHAQVTAQPYLTRGMAELRYAIERWSNISERVYVLNSAISDFKNARNENSIQSQLGLIETYYRLGLHYQDPQVSQPTAARNNFNLAFETSNNLLNQSSENSRARQFRFLSNYKLFRFSDTNRNQRVIRMLDDFQYFTNINDYLNDFRTAIDGIWENIQRDFSGRQLCDLRRSALPKLLQTKQPDCQLSLDAYCQALSVSQNDIDAAIGFIYPVLQVNCGFLKDEIQQLYHELVVRKANYLISNDDFVGACNALKKMFEQAPGYSNVLINWPSEVEFREGYPVVELYLNNHQLPTNMKNWLTAIKNDTSNEWYLDAKFIILLFQTDSNIVKEDFKDILARERSFRPRYFHVKNYVTKWQTLAEVCYEINHKRGQDCIHEINKLGIAICDSILAQDQEDTKTKDLKTKLSNQCSRGVFYVIIYILLGAIGIIIFIRIIIILFEKFIYFIISLIMDIFIKLFKSKIELKQKNYYKVEDILHKILKCSKIKNNTNIKYIEKKSLDNNKIEIIIDTDKNYHTNKNENHPLQGRAICFDDVFCNEISNEINEIIENISDNSFIYLLDFYKIPKMKKLKILFDYFPKINFYKKLLFLFFFRVNKGDFRWKRKLVFFNHGILTIDLQLE